LASVEGLSLFRLDKYRKVLLWSGSMTHRGEVPLNAPESDWDAREVLQRCLADARLRGTPVAQVLVEALKEFLALCPFLEPDVGTATTMRANPTGTERHCVEHLENGDCYAGYYCLPVEPDV